MIDFFVFLILFSYFCNLECVPFFSCSPPGRFNVTILVVFKLIKVVPDTNKGIYIMRNMMFVLAVLFLVGCDYFKPKDNPEDKTNEDSLVEENLKPESEVDDGRVVVLDSETFPDQKFRWALCRILPVADGDTIPNKYLKEVDELSLSEQGIASLKGIEFFSALRQLDCSNNQLISFDVTQNTNLEVLICNDNKLGTIDVTKNKKLRQLDCSRNELKSIDVSGNPKLTDLLCDENPLKDNGIDVSHNSELRKLGVEKCKLKVLDVASNPNLEFLYCSKNDFKELNLSNNTKMVNLVCKQPLIGKIDIKLPSNKPHLVENSTESRSGITLTWSKKQYK